MIPMEKRTRRGEENFSSAIGEEERKNRSLASLVMTGFDVLPRRKNIEERFVGQR
jgi:hypothetical protein